MAIAIDQVDAFAEGPFSGNPAAVCVLDSFPSEAWMRNVAMEMNLSETAFVVPKQRDKGFDLRWFTPVCEVDLCGHATVAAAHTLWRRELIGAEAVARFETRSGTLTAIRRGSLIEVDFPATPATECEPPGALIDALGVRTRFVGRNKWDWLIELASEEAVLAVAPEFGKLKMESVRGVTVTAAASEGEDYDFVSRFFAPAAGVDEDPVTGSAHCTLGPHWGERLRKTELRAYQASRRGGRLTVRLAGDRVTLGGKAVTTMTGELHC
jgi:PhzF family phenazine biosynthesis protein